MWRSLYNRRDAAKHLTVGKRNLYAGADFDHIRQFRWNCVVEFLSQGYFQCHAREHRVSKRQIDAGQKENRDRVNL